MAVDDRLTAFNLTRAKLHVYNVASLGGDIILIKPGTVDELGEILTESTLTLKAFPIRKAPFDRDVLQRVGWAENVDMLFYVAKKQIDDLSLTITDIKQYIKIRHSNFEYEISNIETAYNFGTDYLYVVIGAKG